MDFIGFPKISRLSRDCIITEKIDGTNAQIYITEDGGFFTGSRKQWITPEKDNYGFSRWAHENKDELMKLGVGQHFGEWWGNGIQRKYGMNKKVFSLFNTTRWLDNPEKPECCEVVPQMYEGIFTTERIDSVMQTLKTYGSFAAPGFMKPEGIVIYHTHSRSLFKKTIENDEQPKSQV